jgi:hypothetical protein
VIRGTDKDGNSVIMLGHVLQNDPEGHLSRLHADVQAMRDLGIKNLEVTVIPGDKTPGEGRGIPPQHELGKQLGGDIGVHVINRPSEDLHAHVVVDKDGVSVFQGKLDKNHLPEVLATHAFDDGHANRGKKMDMDWGDLNGEVGLDKPRAHAGEETWKRPSDGAELSAPEREHLGRVEERKAKLLEAEPSLTPREAERRARNQLLHEVVDAQPGPVAKAAHGVGEAIRNGNGAAAREAMEALGGITDLAQRRALVTELRRANDNAPMHEILAKLPPEHRAQVEAHLGSLRANPEHVAHAEALVGAQHEAQRELDHARRSGDGDAIAAAQKKLVHAQQAAIDAIVDAYGIDDSRVTQRKSTDAMGYGIERGSIAPSDSAGGIAEALPSGKVVAKNEGKFLFADPSGAPRSVEFIAAALGHEIEASSCATVATPRSARTPPPMSAPRSTRPRRTATCCARRSGSG